MLSGAPVSFPAHIDMEEIRSSLGHENAPTTRRISARFSPDRLRGAAARLELDDGFEDVAVRAVRVRSCSQVRRTCLRSRNGSGRAVAIAISAPHRPASLAEAVGPQDAEIDPAARVSLDRAGAYWSDARPRAARASAGVAGRLP